ncbi:GNAT family protein [Nocardiopsis coralliicola]
MLRGAHVLLRTAAAGDIPALAAVRATPEVHAVWGPADPGRLEQVVRAEVGDPASHVLAIVRRGRVAGALHWHEETDPAYRHAGIDIYLDPSLHGRGLGEDAVRTAAAYLIDGRGHHRITIDPAAGNTAAIRCYTKVGFRPVGVMRSYERGPDGAFHDGLLMDLLAEELVR